MAEGNRVQGWNGEQVGVTDYKNNGEGDIKK